MLLNPHKPFLTMFNFTFDFFFYIVLTENTTKLMHVLLWNKISPLIFVIEEPYIWSKDLLAHGWITANRGNHSINASVSVALFTVPWCKRTTMRLHHWTWRLLYNLHEVMISEWMTATLYVPPLTHKDRPSWVRMSPSLLYYASDTISGDGANTWSTHSPI